MPRRTRRETGEGERRGRAPKPVSTVEEIAQKVIGGRAVGSEGYTVQQSRTDKRYRCPYCEGWIEPGTPHIVAFPSGNLDERRHFHAACWSKQASAGRG